MALLSMRGTYLSIPGPVKKISAKMRAIGNLIFHSRQLLRDDAPIPELRHLAFSRHEGLNDVLVNRKINKKIKDRFFADRLVIIAALGKSASTVISDCIHAMHLQKWGEGERSFPSYSHTNGAHDLRPELVRDFLEGGVVKFHPRATGNNLKVLELLSVRYVVLVRNPIDQLVATYCNVFNSAREETGWMRNLLFRYNQFYTLDERYFKAGVDVTETIQYMINDGFLSNVFRWIADWSRFRDPARSLLVRYEDFVTQPRQTLNSISQFLYDVDLNDDLAATSQSIADQYVTSRAEAIASVKYPRGWTGKIDVWEDYLSAENKEAYGRVLNSYLKYDPQGKELLKVYPALAEIGAVAEPLVS